MSLYVRREGSETWRETVIRYCAPHGLAVECLEIFDREVASGVDEGEAALTALSEWDCLDYRDN